MAPHKHIVFTLAVLCNPREIHKTMAFSTPGEGFNSQGKNIRNSKADRHMSAAQRARREEEQRRKERMDEVVPGKTSAIPGAKDFEINIQRTEMEWDLQASGEERKIKEITARGMEALRMLKLDEADRAFEALYEIKPNAYCWQAGIVKFYLGDYRAAAECFTQNAHWYESKFGQMATEERIWRQACELKLMSQNKNKNKAALYPPLSPIREQDILGAKETRKVIRIAHELFTSSLENNMSNMVLARAKLRSICGQYDSNSKDEISLTRTDKKMWRLNAWYYLGLHYDVLGEDSASKDCMKMALRQCVSGNGSDVIQTLPMLHMAHRDWFDDDDFEEDNGDMIGGDNAELRWDNTLSISAAEVVNASDVRQSIEEGISKMKLVDLQNELKRRGAKSSGSKSILRDRLRTILLKDAGLD